MRLGKKKREICADCKGICCQRFACTYHPHDIRPFTVEHILYLIEEKGATIGCEEFGRIALLRPRRQGEPQTSYATDETKFGACIHLTEKGCRLPYAERPREGRALKPRRDGNCCYPKKFREKLIKEWSKPLYQNILDQVLIEINPKAFVSRVDIKMKLDE